VDEWDMLISDTDAGLRAAVGILMRAFDKWGVENTLAFVRQGRSGFDPQRTSDWKTFAAGDVYRHTKDYLDCIKTYLAFIDDNPALFWDEHRPNISLEHI
jgi:hypothetical protein